MGKKLRELFSRLAHVLNLIVHVLTWYIVTKYKINETEHIRMQQNEVNVREKNILFTFYVI